MRRDLITAEAVRWLRYAEEDSSAAVLLLQQTDIPRHVCQMAQQSAEKAIKSIYAFLDQPIPKSHDLDLLKNLLPDGWNIKTQFPDLSELSFWAVESRYPGDLPEATREDSDAALVMTRAILDSVRNDLHRHGLPG